MYSNEYPYTKFHDINLDWVMEKTKECVEKSGAAESVAQQAKDTAETAQTAAETAPTTAPTTTQTARYRKLQHLIATRPRKQAELKTAAKVPGMSRQITPQAQTAVNSIKRR